MLTAQQEMIEQSKQAITTAILESRPMRARAILDNAIEYAKMRGKGFEFLTALEIRDFDQAIIEAEIAKN